MAEGSTAFYTIPENTSSAGSLTTSGHFADLVLPHRLVCPACPSFTHDYHGEPYIAVKNKSITFPAQPLISQRSATRVPRVSRHTERDCYRQNRCLKPQTLMFDSIERGKTYNPAQNKRDETAIRAIIATQPWHIQEKILCLWRLVCCFIVSQLTIPVGLLLPCSIAFVSPEPEFTNPQNSNRGTIRKGPGEIC